MRRRMFIRSGVTLGLVLSLSGASWLCSSGALADARDDQVAREQRAASEADKARSELEGINSDLAEAVLRVSELSDQLDAAQVAQSEAEAQLAAAQRTHQATLDQLHVAQANLDAAQEAIAADEQQSAHEREAISTLARTEYLSRGERGPLTLLLESKTTADFAATAQAAGMAANVHAREMNAAERRLSRARAQRARQSALTDQIQDLEATAKTQVAAADEAREKAEQATQRVADLKTSAQAAQADLETKKASLQDDLARAEAEAEQAKAEIAKIDEENRRQAEAAAQLAAQQQAQPANPTPGTTTTHGSSIFASPLHHALVITSPYGYRIHPLLGYRKLHMGVDLASACGEQQFASAAGRVVSTRYEGAGGNTVTINHGLIDGISWVTTYRHMSAFAVSPGQTVSQGQLIGYTGATGGVTGCHVHFEIWKNGSTIDPMGML
ncbi:peptidoglycan DD-metalloendopeptidase family protein [Nanchangia anserum]|uniref:Peptidoglycan DD-metalloendopeptidase family protein n=1 Tax=Nanchangia anserum TaxID=2692125 RepID=A0A8I0GG17_9ACTO|nr:M23 family metallopeptidase [Nanchangia anserum]MBD3690162.1 peptidoglycan DD-metalloendopeptidase family protein [Nanchangia anserum]QOX82382.1 peptidoglycan DD-metalloendopeptidase family protein [Nanchangia anserum]